MKTGKRDNNKFNNAGVSLVELLIVIAILSILTGGSALGISLVFSKDAEQCATRLNDAIYKARMNSMSKAGEYVLTINTSSRIAEIKKEGEAVPEETIYLDGDASSSKTLISARLIDGSEVTDLSGDVTIVFDKAKGCVKTGAGYSFSKDGIVSFDIRATRGSKTSTVQLITTTGKHTIGEF